MPISRRWTIPQHINNNARPEQLQITVAAEIVAYKKIAQLRYKHLKSHRHTQQLITNSGLCLASHIWTIVGSCKKKKKKNHQHDEACTAGSTNNTAKRGGTLVESRIYLPRLPVPLRCAQFIQVRRPIDTPSIVRTFFCESVSLSSWSSAAYIL